MKRIASVVAATAVLLSSAIALAGTIDWATGTDHWRTASAWSPAVVPSNSGSNTYDVSIEQTGTYTVDIANATDSFTVNSVKLNAAGATLNVTSSGTLNVLGNLEVDAGTFNLLGAATLQNATVTGSGGTVAMSASTLSSVTVDRTTLLTSGTTTITGGLTLTANAIINDTNRRAIGSALNGMQFVGSQSLSGSGTILFNGVFLQSGGSTFVTSVASQSGTLTIAPGVTLKTGTGSGSVEGNSGGQTVNQGTIWAATAGQSVFMLGSWTNTGVLKLTAGTLDIGGTISTSDIGTITRTGGTLRYSGTINNSAANLVIDNAGVTGTITGGSVSMINGSTTNSATFANASIDGSFTGQSVAFNSATLAAGASVQVSSVSLDSVSGSGEIVANGSSDTWIYPTNIPPTSMLFGQGVTVRTGTGSLMIANYVPLTNAGTISSQTSGKRIVIGAMPNSSTTPSIFTNTGLLQTLNGGMIDIHSPIPVNGLGSFDSSGGAITLYNTLSNVGNSISLDGSSQILVVGSAGAIDGGELRGVNGAFIKLATGTLRNITLDINVTANGGTLYNCTLNSGYTVTLGAFNAVTLTGTLSGNGTVAMSDLGGLGTSGNCTLGPGITVNSDGAGSFGFFGGGTIFNLDNQGVVNINSGAKTFGLGDLITFTNTGMVNQTSGAFNSRAAIINNGTWSVTGGTFQTSRQLTNNNTFTLTTGTATLNSFLQDASARLDMTAFAPATHPGFYFTASSTVSLAGNLEVDFSPDYYPTVGDSLQIFSSSALAGTFANIYSPQYPQMVFQPLYTPTQMTLQITFVPEPATLSVLVLGSIALLRRRQLPLRN